MHTEKPVPVPVLRRIAMVTPTFIMFWIMLFGAAGVIYLGYCAKTTPTDDKHIGKFNVLFTISLICYVLVLSRMPYISIATDTFVDGMNFVSKNIAEKFNNQHGAASLSAASTSTFPAQPPTDFVEWVSDKRIQPKAGVTPPYGWRVSYTDGVGPVQLVDKPIDVDETRTISVYWDPNNQIFPGQASGPAIVLPNRP